MPFKLARTDKLILARQPPLTDFYILSPFVWNHDDHYDVLVRAVNFAPNPADKVARIYWGESSDGLHFIMDAQPVIAPGPGPEDLDGCEDPTVAFESGLFYVYYTGWNEAQRKAQLLYASGRTLAKLEKRGPALPESEAYGFPKEATIVRAMDGTWRLFFEYWQDDRSKIELASSSNVDGPWRYEEPLFEARPNLWDGWHLSTGPMLLDDPQHPIMFYNGATRDPLRWRIGWVEFDERYTRATRRCDDFLIGPGEVYGWDSDIAFAASAVEGSSESFLYYSVSDRSLMRATLIRS